MVIGQGAGVAAALAAKQDSIVQDLDYAKLRERLLAQKQVLTLPESSSSVTAGDSIAINSLLGIVLDDSQATLTGDWSRSTTFKPYVFRGYVFSGSVDSEEEENTSTASFQCRVPRSGEYQLLMAYSPHPTRARNVHVTVENGTSRIEFEVDQTRPLPVGQSFASLGKVQLMNDKETTISIHCRGTTGFVILDALQLIPVN